MRTIAVLFLVLVATLNASDADAQVTPERLYYGVNRAIPMTVEAPSPDAELQLALYDAGGRRIIARASVEAGDIDLFEVFPVLWNRSQPEPLYLQLLADGEPAGSPVFLEALRPPLSKSVDPRTSQVVWGPNKRRPYTGLRAYVVKFIVFETSEGEFTVKLRPDAAPNTCRHILDLVEGGFYHDIVIHRIIPENANGDPFVIQFGDPQGFGLGGPGFYIDLEPSELPHRFGVMSMARQSDNADSNGSQVFVCLSRAATAHLDENFTAFAEIVDGADTIIALENVQLEDPRKGVPAEPKPVVRSARAVPAPPLGQWPDRISRPSDAGAAQPR